MSVVYQPFHILCQRRAHKICFVIDFFSCLLAAANGLDMENNKMILIFIYVSLNYCLGFAEAGWLNSSYKRMGAEEYPLETHLVDDVVFIVVINQNEIHSTPNSPSDFWYIGTEWIKSQWYFGK